ASPQSRTLLPSSRPDERGLRAPFFLMPKIQNFKDHHQGETAAICGGGVSLPQDLRSIEPVDRLIGVNQHALILPLDYLAFLDRHMWPLVKKYQDIMLVTKLSKFAYAGSHVIHADKAPPVRYSGMLAIWLADYLGFDKVCVCGVDNYEDRKDDREYWWQGPQTNKVEKHKQTDQDLNLMKRFIDELRNPCRIFFASGRLKRMHQ
ncbi:MAG: hypothetical protein RI531_07365, partial [Haloferacaceae archaeon]|nr:hypothetical protein [Haloferacaceae archaeon]